VNSIVARAHLHEEQNLFSEALSDWEILRTIYGQYPGLKFEVERIQKRREQQSRSEAKARWVDQIDASVRSCEFARALDLIQRAEGEFPNDPEISELKKTAGENAQRADRAQALMTQGQDLCGQSRFTEGIALLRQAHALVKNSPVVTSVLANALLEQAQSVMDQDASQAEILVQEAVTLSPSNPLGRSLRSTLLDRKKEQYVADCVSQARRYHAAGDVARALASLDEGVAKYPHESRLIQVREVLQRDSAQVQGRQVRPRDLDEIRRLQGELDRTQDPAAARRIGERMFALGAKYPHDSDFEAVMAYVRRRATQGAPPATVSREETEGQGATRMFSPQAHVPTRRPEPPSPSTVSLPERVPPRPSDIATRVAPGPAAGRAPFVATVTTAVLESLRNLRKKVTAVTLKIRMPKSTALDRLSFNRRKVLIAAGSVLGLGILVWLVPKVIRPAGPGRGSVGATNTLAIAIQTDPPGASIKVDGVDSGISDRQVHLSRGTHSVLAEMPGYQPATQEIEVNDRSPRETRLTLQPALPVIRVSADSGAGRVVYDAQPQADLEGGQWIHDGVTPGQHTLKVSGAQGELSLNFESVPGAPLKLGRPTGAKNVHAVVVASSPEHASVACSFCPAKLSVDGQAEIDIGADGVDLPGMSPGAHRLALRQGSDQHTLEMDIGMIPTLSVFLASDLNVASLLVVTGEDKAQVFLNGQPYKRQTKGGQLLIADLVPKKYVVRVAKSGFQEVAEESVTLKKGEQSRLSFKLSPLPKLAGLTLQGAVPAAEVYVDGVSIGQVQSDGSFHAASIGPGEHLIELRKEGFDPRQSRQHFLAGSTVALGAGEVSMEPAQGTVRITFTPADAAVTLTRTGEQPIKVTSGTAITLRPGSYALTATVADHTQNSIVQVLPGQLKTLELSLTPGGMANWEVPGGWRSDGGVFIRKGGGLVMYKASPTTGTFVFSALMRKGHRLQMDEDYLSRSIVNGAQAIEGAKVPYKSEKKKFRTFQVRISPEEIVTQIQEGQSWRPLDRIAMPGVNLASGRFGFLILGNDEMALSNFRHYAEAGIR
jgi:tetratricopeptide (TPR) repeat protein